MLVQLNKVFEQGFRLPIEFDQSRSWQKMGDRLESKIWISISELRFCKKAGCVLHTRLLLTELSPPFSLLDSNYHSYFCPWGLKFITAQLLVTPSSALFTGFLYHNFKISLYEWITSYSLIILGWPIHFIFGPRLLFSLGFFITL